MASYLSTVVDVKTLDTPVMITTSNTMHYIWKCNNGYFTTVVLPTDDEYAYNLNYILLEVAYFTDKEHCLWGEHLDAFLEHQRKQAEAGQNDKEIDDSENEEIVNNESEEIAKYESEKTADNENENITNNENSVDVEESELSQILFNSINYALSIGATSNCDMSQENLKRLYEKIEDGSFFNESLFTYITEYGKDRYNYEIGYDGLVLCVYYDSGEDLYGFDILEY